MRPVSAGKSLSSSTLVFVKIAPRGVETGSADGEQREYQRRRDGTAHTVASRLWVVRDVAPPPMAVAHG
jgi:hypothetical protein